MLHPHFFCAAQSRANGESVYGTVARIRSWLLLEYPSAWRKNAIEDSRLLSPDLKEHIRNLDVDRVLLVRQHHQRTESLRCMFVRSCGDRPSATVHTMADYNEIRTLQQGGEALTNLMFAVCTHGRHDKCCAKFGMPVWCAFRDGAGDRAWQCSHVGGDRFAANVVLFPYGVYYGRVLPEHVPEIIRRSEAGEIWLPGYRGRSCFPRPVQVAEYFLRSESGRLRIDDFRPLEIIRAAAETRVVFEAPRDQTFHTIQFITRKEALHERLTCGTTDLSPISQYEMRNYSVTHR